MVQRYKVDGEDQKITFTCALHTPMLNANLISISSFDKASLTMTFGGGKGVIRKADGTIVVSGRNVNGMYILEAVNDLPDAMIAMISLTQPISLEQWHHQLTHCSPLMILEMANNRLVEGLKILETMVVGKCEDCILGCQTCHPFDGITEKDLSPLELVYFDLWGPSCVQSVGGNNYRTKISVTQD